MGHVYFAGLPLRTIPGLVMTPRAASEKLVAAALERIGDRPARVADVGTGSGAIALAIALAAPRAEVWATDVSAQATMLARGNARLLGVGDRVNVVRGDLLAPVPGGLDLVVANLPYLPRSDRREYPDLRAEPDGAVFSAGDGLGLYRDLLVVAEEKLVPSGAVIIQLHRDVFVAERDELAMLSESLTELIPARPDLRAAA
jgi:release factor glutamine methyltransferase